ncbi:major facilitator superfamily domain-containing protein [Clohesyomyces aquaticus]|uniref:Major facilitator superfamily domain-containing protein n=1 Tax=Clohesyomyces aquaticus TaxID=1231657 RepID=A0A1Y1Z2Z2_9PLEO|nr:major facilitator superfamily domain-containing protein [Clohesyomyces aquaticus]
MSQRRLPVKQLVILSICRFAEPIALTSVFPYLPEMIESFGVPENDIARWAGVTSSVFSLSQCVTGISWGAASDHYGRKPMILIGLTNTMVTTLIWGFSTSLPMAITARALQGLGNGNVGILRTTVAEMCPWKELQPRAFSIMPLVYTIGAIIGPTLGGAMSNPLHVDPLKPRGDKFLEKYPYILPNFAAACFFFIGIATGWLFLKESLESRKNHRDVGLIVGAKLTAFFRTIFGIPKRSEKGHADLQPLLAHQKIINDEEIAEDVPVQITEPEKKPSIRDVLTPQTTLNLVVYVFIALYSLAYDQLLPVFMHHPPQSIDDPNTKLPLKFQGGFGLKNGQIGVLFTIFSIFSTFCQFFIFPPCTRYFGVLRCLRISMLIYLAVFIVTPFTSLLRTQFQQQVAILILMMIRGVGGTFAFPSSTIMLTNSAASLRVLGTINGLATSVAAVGRAAGPTIGGGIFTWAVKRGYVFPPFWTLAVIALIGFIPTLWLVEGKGFGDDPDEEDGSVASASAASESEDEDAKLDDRDEDASASECEYGEPTNFLTYTSTRSSMAMRSEDEPLWSEDEEEDGDRDAHDHPVRRRGTGSSMPSGARSQSQARRRGSRSAKPLRRRSSVPLGMGVGFRRLSSNLGVQGIGPGGASWGGTGT